MREHKVATWCVCVCVLFTACVCRPPVASVSSCSFLRHDLKNDVFLTHMTEQRTMSVFPSMWADSYSVCFAPLRTAPNLMLFYTLICFIL